MREDWVGKRGRQCVCVCIERMIKQMQWKVNNLWICGDLCTTVLQPFKKQKIISKFKKNLKKQMEVLELKYIKTKIKNWIWLRVDYIPLKTELMNCKIYQNKIPSIKHRDKRIERELRDTDDMHVVYQMYN